MRPLRVYGDENAVVLPANNKTLHSRNKSSPALSAMAAAGTVKPAKRAAFGDVSNTIRGNQIGKEQPIVGGKEQSIQLQEVKKPTSVLLQPAQRPASLASGLRELNTAATNSVKPVIDAVQKTIAASGVHRALSKKNTTIFKDYSTLTHAQENHADVQDIHKSKESATSLKRDSAQDVDKALVPRENEPEKVRRTRSIQSMKSVKAEPVVPVSVPLNDVSALPSASSAYADYAEPHFPLSDAISRAIKPSSLLLRKTPLPGNIPVEQPSKAPLKKALEPADGAVSTYAASSALEQEECYDVDYEEEEENYDDDGYVTARSFRSKVDNLTGNVTTTIIPRINSRVRKELEAAAAIVELSRPMTELEDEAWDVTMVSEYKEEIFDYFKELEVLQLPLLDICPLMLW